MELPGLTIAQKRSNFLFGYGKSLEGTINGSQEFVGLLRGKWGSFKLKIAKI